MKRGLIKSAAVLLIAAFLVGCGTASIQRKSDNYIESISFDNLSSFKVSSKCVSNGKWKDKISNTNSGENLSPDLSWDAVDGATQYAVIMIDGAWVHMDVLTSSTSLAEGEIERGKKWNQYVGPYPPAGSTHTYSVFVFALKNEPGNFYLGFDGGGNNINKIYDGLNVDVDGNSGNVISYGRLDGNYSRKIK